MKNWILITLISCFSVSNVSAAEPLPRETIVSLSAQAMAEVPNDEVVVRFRVEMQGKEVESLRIQVNRISDTISKRLKSDKHLKLKTTNRRVDPVWQKGFYQQKRSGWRVIQAGVITSTDLDGVPKWLDMIEKAGAKLQSLSFRVSEKLKRIKQDELRMQAIGLFREKAATIATSLSAQSYQIMHLQTDTSAPVYPAHREMAYASKMSMDSAAPALASGDTKISVSVHGEIALEKQSFSAQ